VTSSSPADLYGGAPGWSADPRISNTPIGPVGPEGRGILPGLTGAWQFAPADDEQDDSPFRRDAAVHAMAHGWALMDAVTAGTDRLRAFAPYFLPQEPREDTDAWAARVGRSILSPYTTRLIENAAGAVLRRPVQIEGPRYWTRFAANVDGIGSSINEFARRLLVSALTYGHSNVLVDYPDSSADRSLLESRLAARRPYFNHIRATRVLGWRQSTELPSSPLSQVRIFETVRVAKGNYGERIIDQARIIEPGRTKTVRRKNQIEQYDAIASGAIALEDTGGPFVKTAWEPFSLPIIPIVPMYTNRVGTLRSSPLLSDIAHINIAHYQRQADFLHALHIAAMPNLVLEGWDESNAHSVGVNYAIGMQPGNKAYYVQSDASSFEAQANALMMLEQQMSNLGVTKLLGQKFVAESADAKRIDQAQANSVLSIISMELESCLQQCFNIAAIYLSISPPKISISRDFDYRVLIGQDISVIGELAKQGLLSPAAFVKVMQGGEIYPDAVDLQAETEFVTASIERLQQQQQNLLDAQPQPNENPPAAQAEGSTSQGA
jgi:hypothetical protein